MDVDEQMKWKRENAQKRAAFDRDLARRKEQERTQRSRDELAREKKRRLDSWMENGGDPADFARAWPQMQTAIMEERFKARQARAEDVWS